MDWDNTAHILETFVQHGGRKALTGYMMAQYSKHKPEVENESLDRLTRNAAHVFGRMVGEPAMTGDHWKMGELVRDSADRLKRYLRSGEHSDRTYTVPNPKHREAHKQVLAKEAVGGQLAMFENMYKRPTMSVKQFTRFVSLPGVGGHVRKSYKFPSKLPHHLQSRNFRRGPYTRFETTNRATSDYIGHILGLTQQTDLLYKTVDALQRFQGGFKHVHTDFVKEPHSTAGPKIPEVKRFAQEEHYKNTGDRSDDPYGSQFTDFASGISDPEQSGISDPDSGADEEKQ